MLLAERVKPEMHQSVVEIGTGICANIQEAKAEIRDIRRQIVGLARDNGLRLVGRRHPSLRPLGRPGDLSRRPLPHHRRGPEDGGARQPHLRPARAHRRRRSRNRHPDHERRALFPAAHPGALLPIRRSGWAWTPACAPTAARCSTNFRAPISPILYASWSEFENYVDLLIRTNCIDNAKKIWWDIRPHPALPDARIPHLRHAHAATRKPSPSRRCARR